MKTAYQWLDHITKASDQHACDCICERCEDGREVFLLPSDIAAIQEDARKDYHQLLAGHEALRDALLMLVSRVNTMEKSMRRKGLHAWPNAWLNDGLIETSMRAVSTADALAKEVKLNKPTT